MYYTIYIITIKIYDNIKYLQMNNNEIEDWNTLDILKANKKLQTVYLEHNPIAKDPNYRRKIMLILPWLEQLDATLCKRKTGQQWRE